MCVWGSSQVAWLEYDKRRKKLSLSIVLCTIQRRLACLDASLLSRDFLFQSVGFLLCLPLFLCRLLTGVMVSDVPIWSLVDSSDVEMLHLQCNGADIEVKVC